ncbi:MAG: DnaA/Hda family protein, partial [Bacteroidota bacterium]
MPSQCEITWNNCLEFIKGQVSEQSFKTWFTPIVPKKFENNVLTIQVPSQFFYEWLEEHYLLLLRQVIDQELGPEGRLEYSIIVDQGNNQRGPFTINLPTQQRSYAQFDNTSQEKADNTRSPFELKSFKDVKRISCLNPNYTFENFIEGDCNQLAKSAAQAVAKKPGGTSFNPLMFYGRVGLGKTHVVQAIGNEVK